MKYLFLLLLITFGCASSTKIQCDNQPNILERECLEEVKNTQNSWLDNVQKKEEKENELRSNSNL